MNNSFNNRDRASSNNRQGHWEWRPASTTANPPKAPRFAKHSSPSNNVPAGSRVRTPKPMGRLMYPPGPSLEREVVIPPPREVDPDCICDREVKAVICKNCGDAHLNGKIRVQKTCPSHPKRLSYACDISSCKKCKSLLLWEVPKPKEDEQ